MRAELIEVMRNQASAIYWAITGNDVPQTEPGSRGVVATAGARTEEQTEPEPGIELEEVARRFVELEALARSVPEVAEHVPPFSFMPALDAVEVDQGLLIEVALPAIELGDISVERSGELLIITGSGRGPSPHCRYHHAEISRGPFYRAFRLPIRVQGEPQVELDKGLLKIRLNRLIEPSSEPNSD